MATAHLTGEAKRMAHGARTVEVEATDVRGLIDELERKYPGIGRHLREGTSIAVDGEIMPNADFVEVTAETEVHFLPAIGGGSIQVHHPGTDGNRHERNP